MKKCSRCGEEKELSEFYADKSRKDGMSSFCKECTKSKSREYYKDNKEECLKRMSKWAKANSDKVKITKDKYAATHIVEKREYEKRRREKNPEYNKQWRAKNKDKIKEYKNNKRGEDINYKLSCYLRTRVSSIVSGYIKGGSAVKDLGCSVSELKTYIEKKFLQDMSWENYGEWHIDHIKPLASFDLTDREQFLEACHYTNLQPLWARDNISKGAKISEEFGNV